MASTKERQRWDAMYSAITRRMERQRLSLTRIMAVQVEANAALLEIANMECKSGTPGQDLTKCIARAQQAIEVMAQTATSIREAVEESDRQFDEEMKEAKEL